MIAVDSIINSKWIAPGDNLAAAAGYLTNHSLVINAGNIVDLLPQEQAINQYQANQITNLEQHLLIPGLINNHTHAAMNLLRGYADDLELMDWLNNHMWPAEKRWLSQEFVRDGSQLAIAEMLRGGITQFNDMYFFPEITAEVAQHAGIKAHVGAPVFDFPCAWADGPKEYFKLGDALCERFHGDPLITCNIGPHAPYTVSDANMQQVAKFAKKHNCRINLHLHETAAEIEDNLKKYGKRPLRRLSELGLFETPVIAIHMANLNDEDQQISQKHQLHIVTCPESNLKLASGFCEVARLQELGLNVSIGTDGAASNNDLDMFSEMRTTALLAKAVSKDPTACDAQTTLNMATINAAHALGVAERTGSLAIGKDADVVAVAMDSLDLLPIYNPISQLIYASGRQQVTDVWVRGQRVLNNRQLTTLDEAELHLKAASWAARIA